MSPPSAVAAAAEPPLRRLGRLLLPIAAAALLLGGWGEMLFLTDDAFIAFRYARNLLGGEGLVWNPAPFPPVEGYTSLLWVLLLSAVWGITGVPPDVSANLLSLLCGGLSLLLVADMVRHMALPELLQPHRGALLALVLLGVLTNRTFLTWLSSGLETALFNLLVLWWLREVLAPASPRSPLRLAGAGTLLALTRPDGLLYVALGLPLLVRAPRWQAAPLLALPVHFLWRWHTYGAWLPNTYTAKVSTPWPEAGWRYLASFALENGTWTWGLLVLAALASGRLAGGAVQRRHLLAAAALAGHVGYYTILVGGDHFEYRVLSHLIAPLLLSAAWLAVRLLPTRPGAVAGLLLAVGLSAWPLAWTHHALTRDRLSLATTEDLAVPLAPHFPAPLRPVVAAWDDWQGWLIRHFVCKRRQEHQAFLLEMVRLFPDPEDGAALRWDRDRALWWSRSVGYAGWALPHVAIIDALGLNDPVVARGPTRESLGLPRRMAHDRQPPEGFMDCFRFNIEVVDQQPRLIGSTPGMSDEEVRDCYRLSERP